MPVARRVRSKAIVKAKQVKPKPRVKEILARIDEREISPQETMGQAKVSVYKTQLSDALIERIIEGLRDGLYLTHAAGYAFVNGALLAQWLSRGRKVLVKIAEAKDVSKLVLTTLDEQCAVLQLARLHAEACVAKECHKALMNPDQKNWQRYSAVLERRFPALYSQWFHDMDTRDLTMKTAEEKSTRGVSGETAAQIRTKVLGLAK